ncbi:uroporphyrinogen-III synthase [Wenzhouxiangella sp. XN79A]|uniref:uroporphyrinogen-III synthase n=1 Tax=Wenzhouxiangella sp. XN79A TaxID=2724193 RepID=UPI00144AC4FA|nr:uroporphyrinogen-III synthase [Wenzhouxiangella sp. XN79A]NKI35796.1 uroporphyrinogen-III synthase [Wenzhouxiangella sp. XN79A]
MNDRPGDSERAAPLVVVTRAGTDEDSLGAVLSEAGLAVIRAPMFALEPVDERALAEAFEHCRPVDGLVITSPRAAAVALRALGTERLADCRLVAPGPGTAGPLREAGMAVVHPASGGTSEDVLALSELAAARIEGRRFVILAAPGGRTRIARTLRARGATVDVLAPYRRVPLEPPPALLEALGGDRSVITLVSSPATLERLAETLPEPLRRRWRAGRFVVSSARLAARARALGIGEIVQADGASDTALRVAVERLTGLAPGP